MESKKGGPQVVDLAKYQQTPVAQLLFFDSRFSDDEPQGAFQIWDSEILKVGRDPRNNTYPIKTDQEYLVSRKHCEFYTVVYEHSANHIYVRDRKSVNGTWVNGHLIGIGPEITSGHLLQDGDEIEIRPHWRFVLRQTWKPPEHPLPPLQREECRAFTDKYEVTDRCIGQGSEGAIYLALRAGTTKQLACKVVNLGRLPDKRSSEEKRRKLQEADILRQLEHPHILPYVDAISSPHTLYTFTELASGGDLLSFVLRQDAVSELDARIILRQVVRGLEYLHSRGVVHRDLKLENILLAYSPKIAYHRVMLSDFGTCAVPRRSRMRTYVGTEHYQAPEIFQGAENQTPAVDIWSLGVVALYVLLSCNEVVGDLDSRTQQDLDASVQGRLASVAPPISADSRSFVSRCLQTAPARRMTAAEAQCHDWFCRPKKHADLFRELDQRMLRSWSPQTELKPMPLEIVGEV